MKSFKKYNLNDKSGATQELAFTFPGEGPTGIVLHIRSQYSKEFREADSRATRQISSLTVSQNGAPIDPELLDHIELGIFASLVAGWTFEEECTPENVIEFLAANPHTKDEINKLAARDSLFFGERVSQ